MKGNSKLDFFHAEKIETEDDSESEGHEPMYGPFEIQETIQKHIHSNPKALGEICDLPEAIDKNLWQYEHLRQIVRDLNSLVAYLHGKCTRTACPVMKATDDWVFLCAAHKSPKECCAYEYIAHTLDGTNSLLTNNKIFPSRVSIPSGSAQYFQSIARRLYRIFSHTYFHHPDIFVEFEEKSFLCHRFVYFALAFNLIPKNLLIIPDIEV